MTSKDEAARYLARIHFEVEPGMTHIFRVRGSEEAELREKEPLKLLEVNEDTVPAGVLPLYFSARPDIPFPMVIIEITPDEYRKVAAAELNLPKDWRLAEELPRPALDQAV